MGFIFGILVGILAFQYSEPFAWGILCGASAVYLYILYATRKYNE